MTLHRLYIMKSSKHFFQGNWDAALKEVQTILPIVEESGELALVPMWQLWEAIFSFANGSTEDYKKAKKYLQQLTSLNFLSFQPWFLGWLAEGCQINGWVKEGLDSINEALSPLRKHTKSKKLLSAIFLFFSTS